MNKIRKYLRRLRNWWNLPPACKRHGRSHLYQHGYENEWSCVKCFDESQLPKITK